MPKAVLHLQLDRLAAKLWRQDWVEDPTCRQTKHWFPEGPRPAWSFALLNQPRIVFGQLVGFLTGHNHLRRHQAIIDGFMARVMEVESDDEAAPDKWCDFCGGGEQTTEHVMSFCDKFAQLRLEVFGTHSPTAPYTMEVSKVISFLKQARIESLEMYESFKHYLQDKGLDGESDRED